MRTDTGQARDKADARTRWLNVEPAPVLTPRMQLIRLHVARVAIELQIKALREQILGEAGRL